MPEMSIRVQPGQDQFALVPRLPSIPNWLPASNTWFHIQ